MTHLLSAVAAPHRGGTSRGLCCRRGLAVLVLLGACLWPAHTEGGDAIPLAIELADGRDLRFSGADTEIVATSAAGELRFRLASIRNIVHSSETTAHFLETATGNRWRCVLQKVRIPSIDAAQPPLEIDGDQLKRLRVLLPRAPVSAYPGMKLLLKDGTSVFLDTCDLDLDVHNECGTWRLPVGALQAVKILYSSESEKAIPAVVRYPSGYVERLTVEATRSFLTAGDFDGNHLKVNFEEIVGLIGPTSMFETSIKSTDALDTLNRVSVTSRDGRVRTVILPTVVLTVKTDIGTFEIPSHSVRSIVFADDRSHTAVVETIFGGRLVGRVSPAILKHSTKQETPSDDIDMSDCLSLEFIRPVIRLPEGWFLWHIGKMMALCARLSFETIPLESENGKRIMPSRIRGITAESEGGVIVRLDDGSDHVCHPVSRKVGLVSLLSGTRIDVPWIDVREAGNPGYGAQPAVASARPPVAPPAEEPRPPMSTRESPVTTPDERARILLDAAFGTLSLAATNVACLYRDRENKRHCLVTARGDAFVCDALDEMTLASLAAAGTPTAMADEATSLPQPSGKFPTGNGTFFAIRLLSGDLFRARILAIHSDAPGEANETTSVVRPSELLGIDGAPEGTATLRLTGNRSVNANGDGALIVRLASDGQEFAVPIASVDAAVRGTDLDALPPPRRQSPEASLRSWGDWCSLREERSRRDHRPVADVTTNGRHAWSS